MRAADSATKRREVADFDRPAPSEAGTSPPGQPDRTPEFARRDVDQHLVHRPFAEPILADRALPAWQRAFRAVKTANARTLNPDLAAVEADLALRSTPAMRSATLVAGVTRAANRLGVLLHHFAQSLSIPAAGQNRSKFADMPASASVFTKCVGIAADVIGFFMVLLCFCAISALSLLAQGEQRRSPIFNIPRDISRKWRERRY